MSINTELGLNNSLAEDLNIVLVNSDINDYQSLIPESNNAEVILLDSTRQGVEQVNEALANYTDIASIHIISHGDDGTLQLGSTYLSVDNLESYAASIQSWSDSLAEDGDILLYGCSIGSGSTGVDFVTELSELTQADIAASDDLTGNSLLGGDWDLELTIGEIEAESIAPESDAYNYVLPIYNDSEYRLSDFLSWEDAQAQAESLGGNLVAIDDAAEQEWLIQTFGQTERFWIGLSDRDEEGNFEWVNGQTTTYRNWKPGQPSNFQFYGALPEGEDYALMNWDRDGSGRWNDAPNDDVELYYEANFRGIIEIPQKPAQIYTYNNHKYLLSNELSWEDAQAQAESLGGNLVAIDDAAEQEWLIQTFGQTERFWIGLSDRDEEGNFEWVNGQTTTYRNWKPGQPSNFQFYGALPEGEDYALMNWDRDGSGRWNDAPNDDVELYYEANFRGIIEIDDYAGLDSVIDFDNFTDVSQLTLNGNAAQSNAGLRLTSADKKQHGSVFYEQALAIESNTSFATQFQFQIGGGTDGADGFTFMLQNDPSGLNALGAMGGSLGYGGINRSLAIEFDSFFNSQFDNNNNHISILQDGNVRNSLSLATAPFDLNGGQVLNSWIEYDGESDLLEVYLSDTLYKPATSVLSLNVDLSETVGDRAYLGFSAATGGRVNNHDILNWEVYTNSSLLPLDDKPQLDSIVNYHNFIEMERLNLNGNATQFNDRLRLTSAGQKQSGSAFLDEPIQVNDDTSFATEFQFQIGGGIDGADGFTFMLQNDRQGDRALGINGDGVGYRGIEQSIAIEFDTFQGATDPNNNHLSVLLNGDTSNAVVNADVPFDLNSGQVLNTWIEYDGESDLLEVFLYDTTTKPGTAILSTTVDLTNVVGDRARIGFSAGTGGRVNNHDILNWSFASSDKLVPEGDFSSLIDWPSVAIHAGLTPDGKVLTYGLDANFGSPDSQRNTKFVIWDPKQGTVDSAFEILNMSHPVDSAFCSGMMLLPDGQMLIAGGAIQGDRNAGNDLIHLYNYRTGEIKMLMEGDDLVEARWYPTMTTLTDGRILLQGGRDAAAENGIITPEIYTPGEGSALLTGATSSEIYSNEGSQWWYPRSWVAPNGKVFGITFDDMYYLDPEGDGSIAQVGVFSAGKSRGISSTAVMYDRGKILQTGGYSREATIIDINGETPVLSSAGTSNHVRVWGDSTVLPDGTVFVSGGSIRNNIAQQVAYAAEIWDPKTNTWTVVDSASVPRLYHSTSLLLPDGTVLTAGGTTPGLDSEALSGEIYRPAYLYDESGNLAERPTISSEESLVSWGQSLSATVGAGQQIDRVSLVSFGAVTHSFDMGQRFLELDFSQSGDELTIETPESANVAPPGFYMMFALNEQGVPSEAQIVQIA